MIFRVVILSTIFTSVLGFAQADSAEGDMPTLIQHSKETLSVNQGDQLSLSVEAKGEDLLYRWVRNYKTICRDATCVFDSAKWGVGKQSLTVVVYNKYGSRSVSYFIRVLSRDKEREPEDVKPPMVQARATESVGPDDPFVTSLRGIGYSYKSRDVKIIAKIPRLLNWSERIRSHIKGVVQVGVRQKYEHVLFPSSSVALKLSESGRKGLILRAGSLRSRQIAKEEPHWTVMVGDWLQLDGDEKADFMTIKLSENQARVVVLRGSVRAFYRTSSESALTEGKSTVVIAGTAMDFDFGKEPEGFYKPLFRETLQMVKASSPQYFLKSKFSKKKRSGMFLNSDIEARAGLELGEAIADGQKSAKVGDHLQTLEMLLPTFSKGKDDFSYNMLVAGAYRDLSLMRPAIRFYRYAAEVDPNSGEPAYEIGLMFAAARQWDKAIEWLDKARKKRVKDPQALYYYLGVSHYNLGHEYTARGAFEYSLWEPKNIDLKVSAEDFLGTVVNDRWYGAVGSLGFGYDSNVYRWGDLDRTTGYETESGMYYRGYGSLFYRGYQDKDGQLTLNFDIEKIGYIDSDLTDVDVLDEKFYLNWLLNVGEGEFGRPTFQVGLSPFLELFFYGEERSADMYGVEFLIGAPGIYLSPELLFEYRYVSDPLPGRDDKLDPITHEAVLPSDRSGNYNTLGLGTWFMNDRSWQLGSKLWYITLKHGDSAVAVDDFTDLKLEVLSSTRYSMELQFDFSLQYLSRDYSSSDDGRKDSGYGFDSDIRYYYNTLFWSDLWLDYYSQSSNRDSGKYGRYDTGLSVTLEF